NCPTNSYLMNKFSFKSFIAPPCVGDGGLSLGIGLYAFYKELGRISFTFKNAYYGENNDFSEISIRERYGKFIKSISTLEVEKAVNDITDYPVVWFNGRTEIGPRALGNRSLISDP